LLFLHRYHSLMILPLDDYQDVYRLRVSNYRVIYKVLDEERIIPIGRIRHSPLLRHRRPCS